VHKLEREVPHEKKATLDFICDASHFNQRLTEIGKRLPDGRTEEFNGPGDARSVSPEKKSAEFGEP
jgi:hypothetical protein